MMTTTYRWQRSALVFSLFFASMHGFSVAPPIVRTQRPAIATTFRTAVAADASLHDDDETTAAAPPLEEEDVVTPPAAPAVQEPTPAASSDTSRPIIGSAAPCTIKVIGVGGGGGNAINHMVQSTNSNTDDESGLSFLSINTDAQALSTTQASTAVNIGQQTTRGLGAGGDPATGAQAALESMQELEKLCQGADMVFITAGMGGGTGSGAAPVLAQVAQDSGCLTVAVVTKPFAFEGRRRMLQAEDAIQHLSKHVDTMIVISNDKLLEIVPDDTPIQDAFLVADDILRQGVMGISEIILRAGLVNVDFADVRAVMTDAGNALMGIGRGRGNGRATEAAIAALSSPLLDVPVANAQRVVFNIVGGPTLGLSEVNEASAVVYDTCDENANIIFGATIDPDMGDEVSVTVLACGFGEEDNSNNGKSTSSSNISPREPSSQPSSSSSQQPNDRPLSPAPMKVKRGFTKPTERSKNEGGNMRRLFGRGRNSTDEEGR